MRFLNSFRRRTPLNGTSSVAVGPVPIAMIAPHLTRLRPSRYGPLATILPGDSVIETTTVGGLFNFFNIYGNLIVARILLSWFPRAQSIRLLQPLYTVCDPFLNFFRGVVPPIFGLDLSPILGLFLLQAFGTASLALGAEVPAELKKYARNPTSPLKNR